MQSILILALSCKLRNIRLLLKHILQNRASHTYFFIQQETLLPNMVENRLNAMKAYLEKTGAFPIGCGGSLMASNAQLN